MFRIYLPILLGLVFFSNCRSTGEDASPDGEKQLTEQDLSGTYEGFKIFNKSNTDSLPVSLKLEWVAKHEMKLEEITPFKHVKDIQMNGMEFSYDRGIGEDDCGVISMKGTGNFKGTHLYVIETIRCVKGNGPDKFIEYRVNKM